MVNAEMRSRGWFLSCSLVQKKKVSDHAQSTIDDYIFHYEDLDNRFNCNLKITGILELVFFLVMDTPLITTATIT